MTRHSWGLPSFSLTLDLDKKTLSMWGEPHVVPREERAFFRFFKAEPLVMSLDDVLSYILARIDAFAGPFAVSDLASASFDVGALVGRQGIVLERLGLYVTTRDVDGRLVQFDGESVVAIEVLMGLAEMLAGRTDDEGLKSRWSEFRSRALILPWYAETADFNVPEGHVDAEAVHYAAILGQSLHDYKGAAIWLKARQTLFGFKQLDVEPSQAEYDLEAVLVVPDEAALDALVDRAAALLSVTSETFRVDAVHERNTDARQILLYGRWYRPERPAKAG